MLVSDETLKKKSQFCPTTLLPMVHKAALGPPRYCPITLPYQICLKVFKIDLIYVIAVLGPLDNAHINLQRHDLFKSH